MNTAKIIAVTQPLIERSAVDDNGSKYNTYYMTAEEFIAYTARVSNPSNQHNTLTAPKLLQYLITHKHWSPLITVAVMGSKYWVNVPFPLLI